MTHQAPPRPAPPGTDPGRQIAQLREALELVERISGRAPARGREALLDEAARVSDAYDRALPIVQRRFDTLAVETAAWAAAGVEALLVAGASSPPRSAAMRLALRLDHALDALKADIGL
ncbi:MAG TPA: hypothetical protein VN231_14060 [Allosphingosinicella sp.]|nr:hypothetical protein [Allosphingosinicella sp.]